MNNRQFENVTPELLATVKDVIAESIKHTYSTSKVYRAHNRVFDKQETPSTCGSCLKMRVLALKRWLSDYEHAQKKGLVADLAVSSEATQVVATDEAIEKVVQKVKRGRKTKD